MSCLNMYELRDCAWREYVWIMPHLSGHDAEHDELSMMSFMLMINMMVQKDMMKIQRKVQKGH